MRSLDPPVFTPVQDLFDTGPIAGSYESADWSVAVERQQLEYFVAIVEHSSFTRAAASLNVSQPSLSRAMKSLERELGVELFRRTGRDIIVTDAAWDLARRARMIVHDFDALMAAAQAKSGAVGPVEIATTPSTAIEPMTTVVNELRFAHPSLTAMAIATQNAAEVVAAVDRGRCEIGLCGQVSKPTGQHIIARQIGHTEIVLVSPPDSPLVGLASVSPSALRGQRFILPPPRTTLRLIFEQITPEVGDYTVAVEVGHRVAIIPMVLRGVGVALHVREWTGLAEQAGAGVSSLEPTVRVPIWLVRRKDLSAPAVAIAEAIERYADNAA